MLHALRCGYGISTPAEAYGNEQDVGDAGYLFERAAGRAARGRVGDDEVLPAQWRRPGADRRSRELPCAHQRTAAWTSI